MLKNNEIKKRINLINKKLLSASKTSSESLSYVMGNMELTSGKRVRGLLVILASEIKGGKTTAAAVNTAAAIELLHNATLIHDDIVDYADKRRGKSALYKKIGYEFSVLSGDYLFSLFMQLILMNNSIELFRVFAEAVAAVCEGEIDEVYYKNNANIGRKRYYGLIEKKTGALITASVKAGACLAGLKGRPLARLAEFGRCLGAAFQIKDDILDVTGSGKTLGKPAGHDIIEGKVTLPLIIALENAPKKESAAVKRFFTTGRAAAERSVIIAFIKKYGGIEAAEAEAERLIKKALLCLEEPAFKNKKELLQEIAKYVINRSH